MNCGGEGPLKCAGCRDAYFCGKNCQVKAWPNHKILCRGLKGVKKIIGSGKEHSQHELVHKNTPKKCMPLNIMLLSEASRGAFFDAVVDLSKTIIEVGSGNGSLSYELTCRGVKTVTIDPAPKSFQSPCILAGTPNFKTVDGIISLYGSAMESDTVRSKKICADINQQAVMLCAPPPSHYHGGNSMHHDVKRLVDAIDPKYIIMVFRTDGSDMTTEMWSFLQGTMLFGRVSRYNHGEATVAAAIIDRHARDIDKPNENADLITDDSDYRGPITSLGKYLTNTQAIMEVWENAPDLPQMLQWEKMWAACITRNSERFASKNISFSLQLRREIEEMHMPIPPARDVQYYEENHAKSLMKAILKLRG